MRPRPEKGKGRPTLKHEQVGQQVSSVGGRKALLHRRARIALGLTLTARQNLSEASRARCSSIHLSRLGRIRGGGGLPEIRAQEMPGNTRHPFNVHNSVDRNLFPEADRLRGNANKAGKNLSTSGFKHRKLKSSIAFNFSHCHKAPLKAL